MRCKGVCDELKMVTTLEIPKWSPTLVLNEPNGLDFTIRNGMWYITVSMAVTDNDTIRLFIYLLR